jgi:hypothetical protein
MPIRNLTPQKSAALARLRAMAADDKDADPEAEDKLTDDDQIMALKEGVAAGLSQNQQFSEALHAALDEFDAHWIAEKDLTTEGVLFIKKNPEAKAEEVGAQLTATVACFMKYLKVPKGTEENVELPVEEGEEDEDGDSNGDDTDKGSEE